MRRVVITGMGINSSLGNAVDDVAAALRAGRCNFEFFEHERLGIRRVPLGKVVPSLGSRCRGSIRRNLSRAGEFAMAAALDALADGRLTREALADGRVGIAIGSSGERKDETRRLDFSDIKCLPCAIAAALACHLGVRARTIALQSFCTTGLANIGYGFQQIRADLADIYIAGGADHVDEYWVRWFSKGLLFQFHEVARADEAMRPFAPDRTGAVLSEGAGIVVLEDLAHALARGAPIHAEVLGFAENNNGKSMYATDVDGVRECVLSCLADARMPPRTIDYVNPHGTATPSGDATEAEVIRTVFDHPVPVSATKAMNGHSMSATAAHELIHTLLMLRDQFIAPSINCPTVDPECRGINLVRETVEPVALRTILSMNAGFGGVNAAMVIGRCA